MSDLLKTLLLPENRLLTWILVGMCTLTMATLIYLSVRGRLKFSIPMLLSVEPGDKSEKNNRDAEKPESVARGYCKIQYVKVVYLSDRAKGGAPFYRRNVKRLPEADRAVAVFDEAVFYTLELLPQKGPLIPRKDRSSGVLDSRLVIPWHDEVLFRDSGAGQIKEWVQLESDKESDTFLAVSHFENGLQGNEQDVATDVTEDADYARLIVDFSSIPNAAKFITADRAISRHNGQEELIPISQPSPALFSVMCKDVKKSTLLKIHFTFDWSRNA